MEAMIISHIEGGLGNQFLQYAAGYGVAKANGVPFKVHPGTCFCPNDVWAKNDVCHWQLNHYTMKIDYASRDEVYALHPYFYRQRKEAGVKWRRSLAKRLGQNPDNLTPDTVFLEGESSHYDERLKRLRAPHYIRGYFPSYKYFHPLRNDLLEMYQLNHSLSVEGDAFKQQILKAKTPIAVHFRRGDVVADPHLQTQFSGIATTAYYKNAIKELLARLPEGSEPHFFAFSNDIQWVKENFQLNHPITFVDHSKAFMAYEDVALMNLCHHHVLAGFSSFSFWGAYLSQASNKQLVFVTQKVSNNPLYNHPDDVFLPDWIRIPSV
jgi:hypothetical protein